MSHELRQLKDQEQKEKAERHAVEAAERQAKNEAREQASLRRQQACLEAARQQETRRQAAREAEAQVQRRHWETAWLEHALESLPQDVPHGFQLAVHEAVAELLSQLDSGQPDQLTQRLVQAGAERALQPWYRQKEVENIIDQTRNQLPFAVRSWGNSRSEWEVRIMRAAADAIAELGSGASLATIRGVAIEAGAKVCAEYNASKAAEDHRRACKSMVRCVFEGEDAREAVRQALEKLPVGATRAQMEHARDAALAPFRAAKKAAEQADLYLLYVSTYIEELGNEGTGEWDLGDWSERYRLSEKIKTKLRLALIQKLLSTILDWEEAHSFIEEFVDRVLDLED